MYSSRMPSNHQLNGNLAHGENYMNCKLSPFSIFDTLNKKLTLTKLDPRSKVYFQIIYSKAIDSINRYHTDDFNTDLVSLAR